MLLRSKNKILIFLIDLNNPNTNLGFCIRTLRQETNCIRVCAPGEKATVTISNGHVKPRDVKASLYVFISLIFIQIHVRWRSFVQAE